jgi:hypothetical protein
VQFSITEISHNGLAAKAQVTASLQSFGERNCRAMFRPCTTEWTTTIAIFGIMIVGKVLENETIVEEHFQRL